MATWVKILPPIFAPLNATADLDEIEIRICPCSKAASQLLRLGFFPCAPLEPSFAVELRVLEFCLQLFLNMPPNNTALTKTLETYMDSMGFKLDNRVC